jgi:uncharacterized protein (TIGR02569 family)
MNPERPNLSIAKAFGADEEPILLEGGEGKTYRSGNVVLKPSGGPDEADWAAELFNRLPQNNNVRLATPIKSVAGTWVYEGFVAWSFLEGKHIKGDYKEKLVASRAFHRLIKNVPQPAFLPLKKDSWSVANRAAWNVKEFHYDEAFLELIRQIEPKLKPLDLPNQLIHGDMGGNFLMQKTLPPALIDFSPAWAPDGFAEGILLADAIVWEDAKHDALEVFKAVPNIEQMAWRGTLRRILEQAEHIPYWGKNKETAIKDARAFQKAIDYLEENFR